MCINPGYQSNPVGQQNTRQEESEGEIKCYTGGSEHTQPDGIWWEANQASGDTPRRGRIYAIHKQTLCKCFVTFIIY